MTRQQVAAMLDCTHTPTHTSDVPHRQRHVVLLIKRRLVRCATVLVENVELLGAAHKGRVPHALDEVLVALVDHARIVDQVLNLVREYKCGRWNETTQEKGWSASIYYDTCSERKSQQSADFARHGVSFLFWRKRMICYHSWLLTGDNAV